MRAGEVRAPDDTVVEQEHSPFFLWSSLLVFFLFLSPSLSLSLSLSLSSFFYLFLFFSSLLPLSPRLPAISFALETQL